jgi:hypothetical protein
VNGNLTQPVVIRIFISLKSAKKNEKKKKEATIEIIEPKEENKLASIQASG